MDEQRAVGRDGLAHMQTDAGIVLVAMPVAPVALHFAQSCRHLIGRGFDLLQADDRRALALDPLLDLGLPRTDPVDVPGGDLNGWRARLAARSARWPSTRD